MYWHLFDVETCAQPHERVCSRLVCLVTHEHKHLHKNFDKYNASQRSSFCGYIFYLSSIELQLPDQSETLLGLVALQVELLFQLKCTLPLRVVWHLDASLVTRHVRRF